MSLHGVTPEPHQIVKLMFEAKNLFGDQAVK